MNKKAPTSTPKTLIEELEDAKWRCEKAEEWTGKHRKIDKARVAGFCEGIDLAIYFIQNNNSIT